MAEVAAVVQVVDGVERLENRVDRSKRRWEMSVIDDTPTYTLYDLDADHLLDLLEGSHPPLDRDDVVRRELLKFEAMLGDDPLAQRRNELERIECRAHVRGAKHRRRILT
jgi:hypothetical protein